MSARNIHFAYEPGRGVAEDFAQALIATCGQTEFHKADVVVSVGGDGALLHAMRRLEKGQQIFGVVPPQSNSRGFWTNRTGDKPEDLILALDNARSYEIHPLKAVITHQSGQQSILQAFNEVAPSENSGQAMLVNLVAHLPSRSIGPIRIMGDGLIFSTALGSTALNSTYGGPAIDIRNSGIAIVGKGIYEPKGGFAAIIAEDDTSFAVQFLSPGKRPVRVLYDGNNINSDDKDPFVDMVIAKDRDRSVGLLLTEDPSTRAFSKMMP